mmetsp:Transcript_96461/g.273157  ORF Transcript_96461/g.273157 Transcript_96461/m.273157 type:complete len:218 (-) Transcript_96461:41-694(-)
MAARGAQAEAPAALSRSRSIAHPVARRHCGRPRPKYARKLWKARRSKYLRCRCSSRLRNSFHSATLSCPDPSASNLEKASVTIVSLSRPCTAPGSSSSLSRFPSSRAKWRISSSVSIWSLPASMLRRSSALSSPFSAHRPLQPSSPRAASTSAESLLKAGALALPSAPSCESSVGAQRWQGGLLNPLNACDTLDRAIPVAPARSLSASQGGEEGRRI